MGRRLCIFGFCRSIEMLSDVVEDTVLEHGGEVCATVLHGKKYLLVLCSLQFYIFILTTA